MVITDEYSRYPVVEIVRSTRAEVIIPAVEKIFSLFDYPETVKTDNGPPFQSLAWNEYLRSCGVQHRKITPIWPQANAQAESFNKPLMKAVRSASLQGFKWQVELFKFLRMYRCTPHTTTQFTPYRLMFGREPRTKLPQIPPMPSKDENMIPKRDEQAKQAMKVYKDKRAHAEKSGISAGDVVLVKQVRQNKLSTPFNPNPLTVTSRKGSMVTARRQDGSSITRNVSLFRPMPDITLAGIPAEPQQLDLDDIQTQIPSVDDIAPTVPTVPAVPTVPIVPTIPTVPTIPAQVVRSPAPVRPRREIKKPKRLIEQ